MTRLTSETLRGIWAGLPMSWDSRNRIDVQSYTQNIQRMIDARVHGIYTSGSTGEFYALEYEEFCEMVDIQADLCGRAGMPLQIGCCSDATAKTIRLMEYAAGKKAVGGVQVTVPYWMELTDREVLQFFKDIHKACPDLPLMYYNVSRAKRFFLGDDYLRILEAAPNLIGVKFTGAGSNYSALQDAIARTPHLSYFVGENLLASGMLIGARGCCSSLVYTNPAISLELYELARSGQWEKAVQKQKHIAKFFNDSFAFIRSLKRDEVIIDPTYDKGLGVASGCLLGHQRCRAPYIGFSDRTIADFRHWLKENYPEFLYPGP